MATKKTTKKIAKKATKKTAKKSTAKTTAAKKATKKTAKKAVQKTATGSGKASNKPDLAHAPEEQAFWTTDGSILRNLLELHNALQVMDRQVFSYHVSTEKNDFADWVECVLSDGACADALRKSKNPKQAQTVVVRYIKQYNV